MIINLHLLGTLLGFLTTPEVPSPVAVTVAPQRVLLEERSGSHLNFDFQVQAGADSLWLQKVEVAVYDKADALVLRKFVDNNGFSPSVTSLSHRVFAPQKAALVFNPFASFPADVEVARLHYTFEFTTAKDEQVTQAVDVTPERFQPRTALRLPLTGRLLVWDGHDENAHHRRLDFLHPVAQQFGIRSNFMRYAHDFVVVNEKGDKNTGNAKLDASYYGFGQPVLAPAAGRVVAVYNQQPDNDNGQDYFNPQDMVGKDPLLFYGNYVVIDHGNGEFSLLGHLRQGSVQVKVGDAVRASQAVAQVGSSGSSYFPHLHYELRTGKDLNVEGLPAYFRKFRLVRGSKTHPVSQSAIDSGDIVLSE